MYYVAKIEGVRMWDDPKQIEPIISDLEKNKDQITGIELSSNSIGIECAKVLAKAIENLPNLTNVNFRDIFVSRAKEDLPISLEYLMKAILPKNIKKLDLSDNALGPQTIKSFDFFFKENTSLEELQLENDGLGPEVAEEIAQLLSANDKMKLKLIKLSRNRITDKGAIAFSKYFTVRKTLEHIEIFQNAITVKGMAELFKGFGCCENLRVVKCNDNCVKEASEELFKILPNLKNLEIIDISDSLLGKENGLKLFTILTSLPNIKEIHCNYNEIESKKTQEEIFEMCKNKCPHLKVLSVKGNEINKGLFKKYNVELKDKVDDLKCYSEDELDEEEEEEDLADKMGKLNVNK